jgi:hypothetical protein
MLNTRATTLGDPQVCSCKLPRRVRQMESMTTTRLMTVSEVSNWLAVSPSWASDQDEPILAPRQSARGMSRHLKPKMSIASFVQELARLRSLYRESAQHERPGSKSEILICLVSVHADTDGCISAPELLF